MNIEWLVKFDALSNGGWLIKMHARVLRITTDTMNAN